MFLSGLQFRFQNPAKQALIVFGKPDMLDN